MNHPLDTCQKHREIVADGKPKVKNDVIVTRDNTSGSRNYPVGLDASLEDLRLQQECYPCIDMLKSNV